MKVNSRRSTRGYPRQISLKPSKASNKPLCFHDFGKTPVCKSQRDLLAPHGSHPRHTAKHNALLFPPFDCKVNPSPGRCHRAQSRASQEWMSTAWAWFLLWVQEQVWKSSSMLRYAERALWSEALYIQWERGHGATGPEFYKWR